MPQYISKEGFEDQKKELEDLKIKRKERALRLEEAKALGDLSENQEYLAAREAQAFNEGKIVELDQLLKEAVIIDKNKKSSVVQIGSSVQVKNNGNQKTFLIVGSQEANPSLGKISNESPLGKAFLGKRAGEKVKVETPGGEAEYEIISIS
ncbi:MAG: Transcription elongation factor GreA [Parcubacteria group bacterium GW2011_GWB1_42_6]|nr:MAG: Transcription elongation factor GreA [Parcubacteria group bacterium GW2011_GWB1_42_6]